MADQTHVDSVIGDRSVSGSLATGERVGAAAAWFRFAERLLHLPFPLTFIVVTGIVAAGQVTEDLADSPPLQILPPNLYVPRLTIIAAVAYMLIVLRLIERPVQRSLNLVQHVVRIDPSEFRSYWLRMTRDNARMELLLFAISAGIVLLLYPIAGRPLPTAVDPVTRDPIMLPGQPLDAVVILLAYSFVGWAGLRLVYGITRVARALGQLSRQPLVVDVYDVTDLLPFGRIALALSLAPVGLIVVLLIGLGTPRGPASWLVLSLATTASILSLTLPLRGIHRQMVAAKQRATSDLNRELREAHRDLTGGSPITNEEMALVTNRTATLMNLRKVVGEMPTWPFQDTVAFARAMLIASAPLIYTIVSELILRRI